MNRHEKLLHDWYVSIVKQYQDRMIDIAGSEEDYTGSLCEYCYEIEYRVRQKIEYDAGDYNNEPDSHIIWGHVEGNINIVNAEGDFTTEVSFRFDFDDCDIGNPEIWHVGRCG